MYSTKIKIGLLVLVMLGCSPSEKKTDSAETKPEQLDARTFQEKIRSEQNAVVLDVRTPKEVGEGTIADAINVDFKSDDFTQKVSALDKEKTYFIYCASGVRSAKAADVMAGLGYSRLYVLEGGVKAWKEAGYEVVSQ